MNLNVGCGPHYADGWTNTDLVRVEGLIEPDLVVTREEPLPFADHSFDRVYLGHCLEHIPWVSVPDFLANLARVITPHGEAAFVGPDVWRVIDGYRSGLTDRHMVAIVMEERSAYTAELGFDSVIRWDSDRHHWNCYEQRVVDVLQSCGWRDVTAHPVLDNGNLAGGLEADGWPVVSHAPYQFAVTARPPEER